MGKSRCGRVEIWVDGCWTGKTIKEQKICSKTIDIVSYALEMSVNGATCVLVVNFRFQTHLKFVNWLNR